MAIFKRDSLLFSVLLSLKQVNNCASGVISPLATEMFLSQRPFHAIKFLFFWKKERKKEISYNDWICTRELHILHHKEK